jgi:CHASE2 domain-containing sensor protein
MTMTMMMMMMMMICYYRSFCCCIVLVHRGVACWLLLRSRRETEGVDSINSLIVGYVIVVLSIVSLLWFFMLWPWPPMSMVMVMAMAITVTAARFYLNP